MSFEYSKRGLQEAVVAVGELHRLVEALVVEAVVRGVTERRLLTRVAGRLDAGLRVLVVRGVTDLEVVTDDPARVVRLVRGVAGGRVEHVDHGAGPLRADRRAAVLLDAVEHVARGLVEEVQRAVRRVRERLTRCGVLEPGGHMK